MTCYNIDQVYAQGVILPLFLFQFVSFQGYNFGFLYLSKLTYPLLGCHSFTLMYYLFISTFSTLLLFVKGVLASECCLCIYISGMGSLLH